MSIFVAVNNDGFENAYLLSRNWTGPGRFRRASAIAVGLVCACGVRGRAARWRQPTGRDCDVYDGVRAASPTRHMRLQDDLIHAH